MFPFITGIYSASNSHIAIPIQIVRRWERDWSVTVTVILSGSDS